MSVDLPRRTVLSGFGAFMLSPAASAMRVVAPEGAFLLERVLTRSLFDGKQIVVTRRWRIGFSQLEAGDLRVDGTQVAAQVDAPPALTALSQIEAARDNSSLFPMQLGHNGKIRSTSAGAVPALPQEVADAALAYAKARVGAANSAAVTRQFLSDLSAQGAKWFSAMPADLFFPTPRNLETSRDVTLPDGDIGTITIRETASTYAESGLLASYRREATTTTGSTHRTGSEVWSLAGEVL